jgi:long-subunit acyl-CoA synthetase (AMP-forming)
MEGLIQSPSGINNLADFWDIIVKNYSSNMALEEMTYKELDIYARSLGSWLVSNHHNKVFLYAKNCPNWTITDIACWNYGIVSIPLYDTLGAEAFFHIIKLT